MTAPDSAGDELGSLNRLLIAALLALARAGPAEEACRIAARAWSVLRHHNAREAARLTGALHTLTPLVRSDPSNKETQTMADSRILDVRTLVPAERHQRIFATYEGLAAGGTFELVNDHDPKPLYYQFDAEHHGDFSWRYLEQGPAVWRVEIGRPAARHATS